MHPSVVPLQGIIKLNTRVFERAVGDLDRASLVSRFVDHANPIAWIAAHVVWARVGMASFLGDRPPCALEPLFARGAAVPEESKLPQRDDLLAAWRDASATLEARLIEATETQISAPSPRSFPVEDKSILGGLAFLTYHEGYHLGQLALLRKALGHPGLVDG
jgi:hypothetical protein